MNIIEEINLPNGLKLTISDLSRVIAADTKKVELFFSMKVDMQESYFASAADYQTVVNIFGPVLTYEHTLERTFVNIQDESSVRTELLDTFKNNTLQYLSSPNFARKMSLSMLRDIKLNPFKYAPPPAPPEEEE